MRELGNTLRLQREQRLNWSLSPRHAGREVRWPGNASRHSFASSMLANTSTPSCFCSASLTSSHETVFPGDTALLSHICCVLSSRPMSALLAFKFSLSGTLKKRTGMLVELSKIVRLRGANGLFFEWQRRTLAVEILNSWQREQTRTLTGRYPSHSSALKKKPPHRDWRVLPLEDFVPAAQDISEGAGIAGITNRKWRERFESSSWIRRGSGFHSHCASTGCGSREHRPRPDALSARRRPPGCCSNQ